MDIECKILELKDATMKNGKTFWKIKSDKGTFNCFDKELAEDIGEYVDGMVTLAIKEKDGFKNVIGIADDKPAVKPLAEKFIDNKATTMYTSYCKDVFLGILSHTINPQEPLDYQKVMQVAVELVTQARDAFS